MLRPGGLVAPFHHVFQTPPAILDALASAYQKVAPDSPVNLSSLKQALDAYQALFDKIADGIRSGEGSVSLSSGSSAGERTYTRDEWLDQLPTQGHLNLLPPGQAGRGASWRGGRDRRDGRQLHDAVHHRRGHRDERVTGSGLHRADEGLA